MSQKVRNWLSLNDVARESGYTPRQLDRILRRGPPKKLASYCDPDPSGPQFLAAMFHYAFRAGRIKSQRVWRFKDTPQLRWICLFLKLHKNGISPQQYWTAYIAQKLIRPRVDPYDPQTFLGMNERRKAARLAVLSIDPNGFVPREKYSDMVFEFLRKLSNAAEAKERRTSGEERKAHEERRAAEKHHCTSLHSL